MTERLYYTDSYLREFRAHVVDRGEDGRVVYLDRTAFYPDSGGQPHDTGTLCGAAVVDVFEDGDRVAHRLEAPIGAAEVAGAIDWPRRFDHMQQHTGQHLLSAVFAESFGLHTASFHLGADAATIDLEGGAVTAAAVLEAERRVNALVFENRPVSVRFEDASEARGLRKASGREGTLRIIEIEGFDRSACGGTHVSRTGEIGPVLLRKIEKVRNSVRVEFLCGGRAVRRARADYEALNRVAQLYSASLDETPVCAAAQLESARAAEKARRKLDLELAAYHGRDLYAATAPDATGMRRVVRRMASGNLEEVRALAQSFTAQPRALFLALLEEPPAVLLAVSEDAGLDAGRIVKTAVTAAGGRGGGTARVAQGSVPARDVLERIAAELAG